MQAAVVQEPVKQLTRMKKEDKSIFTLVGNQQLYMELV